MPPVPMRRCRPLTLPCLLLSTLLSAQTPAQAQAPAPTRHDPLNAQAPVPALRYSSSFTQFRPLVDGQPTGWREANDAVARIGGWRVYAREAQQPEPTTASPASPASAATAAPAPPPSPQASPPGRAGHQH